MVHDARMESAQTIPGPRLAAQRAAYGVMAADLAERLGIHRNTLRRWEQDPAVDVLRQRRYLTALRQIVDAA